MKKLIFFIFVFLLIANSAFGQEFDSQFERAQTLFKWKYYGDAIVQLDKIIDSNKRPFVNRAKFLKATCYLKKYQSKKATRIFQELIDSRYILTDYALHFLGDHYMSEKKYSIAEEHYRILISKFPNSALARAAKLKIAECLHEQSKLSKAVKEYEEFISRYPNDKDINKALFNLGRSGEKIGYNIKAFDAYNKIALYHPLSKYLKKANQRIRYFSKTYNMKPKKDTAETLFNKAMIFYNKQDYNSAALFLRKIVQIHRKSKIFDKALFKLAYCDYRKRRYRTASTRFTICVNRGSEYSDDAQFYLAFTYGKRGYFYKALSALRSVLNNYPESSYKDAALYYLGYYHDVNNLKTSSAKYYNKLAQDMPESSYADDALWKIGKMNYFDGNYESAFKAFNKVVGQAEASNMSDECAYWKALTLEKMGKKIEAAFAYRYVIERFDHTYYSHRSREKLRSLGINIPEYEKDKTVLANYEFGKEFFEAPPYKVDLAGEVEPSPIEDDVKLSDVPALNGGKRFAVIDLKKHFKKYSELMSMRLFKEAKIEAKWIMAGSPSDRKESAKLALSAALLGEGKYREAIVQVEGICNNSVVDGKFRELPKISWHLSYPKGYYKYVDKYSKQYGIDPYLVLAVIREESRFNPRTLSWAYAHGLMQLIPSTAKDVARTLRIRPYYSKRLYEPELNIRMGCYYLAKLLKRFNGNKMLALAAYNGGPRNVKRWLYSWKKNNGSEMNTDEFVENIPLKETRRYIQKVLKSYNEYKRIYKDRSVSLTDYIYYYD